MAQAQMEEEFVNGWEGPGWYASRQEWGRIRTWKVGDDPDKQPDVYTQGLGTPEWRAETDEERASERVHIPHGNWCERAQDLWRAQTVD